MNLESKNQNPLFPRSILSASREEYYGQDDTHQPLELQVKEGVLPEDLQGHVFIVGPLNSEGQVIFNGDGMIYRIDFDKVKEDKKVILTSRIVKTPCYYAEEATKSSPDDKLKFKDYGVARISFRLGLRNQLNTALLPMVPADSEQPRLLVTWDIGRPYEIDTKTLEAVTPIGWNKDWSPAHPLAKLINVPFQFCPTSAHPCFDPHTKEVFGVSFGKHLFTFFPKFEEIIKVFKRPSLFIQRHGCFKYILANLSLAAMYWGFIFQLIGDFILQNQPISILFEKIFENPLRFICEIFKDPDVYIVRWNSDENNPELKEAESIHKWRLIIKGRPIKIRQTVHQMGLTENYIILLDTAFKTNLPQAITLDKIATSKKIQNSQDDENKKLALALAKLLLDYPQLPDNNIYIVPRKNLIPEKNYVEIQKLVIEEESAHFLVDYKDTDDKISLHMAHSCAWDIAEWSLQGDTYVCASDSPVETKNANLMGVFRNPTDISRLGSWVIDVKGEPKILNHSKIKDEKYTWAPSLFTYSSDIKLERLEDVYLSCIGSWNELLTDYIIELYKDYKYRELSVEDVCTIAKEGICSNLLHLRITPIEKAKNGENLIKINYDNIFQFPPGYFVTSPQFLPRPVSTKSTDGYIVCVVHYGTGYEDDKGNQIWIFDAQKLSEGPICKLWHPKLQLGFTVHTAWLPKIAPRKATYNIPVRKDYKDILDGLPKELQELFEEKVFPHFEERDKDAL